MLGDSVLNTCRFGHLRKNQMAVDVVLSRVSDQPQWEVR